MPNIDPISQPASMLERHYDAVVIGSGYGGGVAASRLARARPPHIVKDGEWKVCVLERGREILPGDYPDELDEARGELQINTPTRHVGDELAMFDFRTNDDVNVLVGCGLGGTSLINANVSLEMDPRQFEEDGWPKVYREAGVLDKYYARAKEMLDFRPFPGAAPNKLTALKQSATYIGKEHRYYRPPLNVNFVDQINKFGVPQKACNSCGDCTSGCNVGAKNTTLMNYLPDAKNNGANIFTHARVEYLQKLDSGWGIHLTALDTQEKMSITADIVVLAAGSLGSTEILIRSQKRGLPLSDQLGKRFSGNGDVLGFGYNCYWRDVRADKAPNFVLDEDDTVDFKKIFSAAANLMRGAPEETLEKTLEEAFEESGIESSVPQNSSLMPDEVSQPQQINGVGVGAHNLGEDSYPGPCITGIIDLRDEQLPQNRLVIEEGVVPGALSTMLPAAFLFGSMRQGDYFKFGPTEGENRLQDANAIGKILEQSALDLFQDCYQGATGRTQTYLVMSKDDAQGELRLDARGRIRVHWAGAGNAPVFHRDDAMLRKVTDGVHGQYISNPLWSEELGRQLVTVHPIGGATMADSAAEGVVNANCQVYDGDSAHSVHAGLYVCDGAVLPAAVGVNPLLTITAIAERACDVMALERGWSQNDTFLARRELGAIEFLEIGVNAAKSKRLSLLESLREKKAKWDLVDKDKFDVFDKESRSAPETIIDQLPHSLQFSEQMRGYCHDIQVDTSSGTLLESPYDLAERFGKIAENPMVASFTVRIPNLKEFADSSDHAGILSGSLTCRSLSPVAMALENGEFELLRIDVDKVETWQMNYRADVERVNDTPLRFVGQKILDEKPGSHWWRDVTTLFVDMYEKDQCVGRAKLTLSLDDLIAQATTLEVEATPDVAAQVAELSEDAIKLVKLSHAAKFGKHFAMTLFRAYGGLLANLRNFAGGDNAVARLRRRKLNLPEPQHYPNAVTGQPFQLTRYRPLHGSRGPVILAPGFGVTADSFATPTVKTNLVEYLTAADYDVWLFDYRASPHSGFAEKDFCIDDIAQKDWFAAVDLVRTEAQVDDVQVVAHCVGSMTLLMALMMGMKGVRSAICSQLTLHPVTDWLNYLKADVDLAKLLEARGMNLMDIRSMDAEDDENSPAFKKSKALDALLYNLPVPPGEECNNPVCKRIFAFFGPSYTHSQLNQETHDALEDMFGTISASSFDQLSTILRRGRVVDRNGLDIYMPRVDALKIPLTFIAGEHNAIFYPETSARTYKWLCKQNGPEFYTRKVFEDYAHMDMFIGKNASEKNAKGQIGPYEYIRQQLDKYN